MFIRAVDEGLERFLRAELPLPEQIGDVAFDAPTGDWAATISRLTINLFLYDVGRSRHPGRTALRRVDTNGVAERRPPLPMMELCYLVSAWAGTPRDEHQLLGDALTKLAPLSTLPTDYLPTAMDSAVGVMIDDDDQNRLRDVWTAAGGRLKASFTLQITVAAEAVDWTIEPPAVTTIEGMAEAMPGLR